MNKHIDIKSLVIGILLAVSIMLAMGAGHAARPVYGRFQLIPAQGYLYIIDADSGEIWSAPSGSLSTDADKAFRAPKVR